MKKTGGRKSRDTLHFNGKSKLLFLILQSINQITSSEQMFSIGNALPKIFPFIKNWYYYLWMMYIVLLVFDTPIARVRKKVDGIHLPDLTLLGSQVTCQQSLKGQYHRILVLRILR